MSEWILNHFFSGYLDITLAILRYYIFFTLFWTVPQHWVTCLMENGRIVRQLSVRWEATECCVDGKMGGHQVMVQWLVYLVIVIKLTCKTQDNSPPSLYELMSLRQHIALQSTQNSLTPSVSRKGRAVSIFTYCILGGKFFRVEHLCCGGRREVEH